MSVINVIVCSAFYKCAIFQVNKKNLHLHINVKSVIKHARTPKQPISLVLCDHDFSCMRQTHFCHFEDNEKDMCLKHKGTEFRKNIF